MAKAPGVEVMQANVKANEMEFPIDDLHEILRAFKEQNLAGRLPVKLGHTSDDTQPAQGWITDMRIEGDKLLADIDDIPEELVAQIKAGRWRYVSIELLRNAERGGKKYRLMPDGLALLGAARPAFDALAGLADVFKAGVPGVTFEKRFAFSRKMETDAEKQEREREAAAALARTAETERLRVENAKLQQELIRLEFNSAVDAGKILPREREAFTKRYGASGSIDDARLWIASSPPVPEHMRPDALRTSKHDVKTFERPDDEMAARTYERIAQERKEFGRDITYLEASRLVMREDPDLARRYIRMPEEFWGGRG